MKRTTQIFVLLLCSLIALQVDAQLGAKQYKKRSTATGSVGNNSLVGNAIITPNGSRTFSLNQSGLIINKIIRSSETHRPIYIETTSLMKAASFATPQQKCLSFLKQIGPNLGIEDPSVAFKVVNVQTDNYNQTHVRISQLFKGIPVYGSDAYVHLNGVETSFHGSYNVLDESLTDQANISSSEAIQTMENDLKYRTVYVEMDESQKKLLDYKAPEANLVYYKSPTNSKYSLAYQVDVRPNFKERWKYFVDATSGNVLYRFNNTQSDGPQTATVKDLNSESRSINTYLFNGNYYMMDAAETMFNANKSKLPGEPVGAIWTVDGKNTKASAIKVSHITSADNLTWDAKAVSAHYGAMATYNYYKSRYGRNSLDGEGGTIISIINVIEEDGTGLENAFWNGKAMFFGNGATLFKPLAGGLDVVAHELGHGVIEHTANLEYQDQSGALNESFADISGVMVDDANWTMGEKITKVSQYFPNGILRDMSNPHNGGSNGDAGWQPSSMSEFYTGKEDNGGVHINSGIPNYAFYLFATGTGMTRAKAGAVYYDVLSKYLTKFATFADLRIAVIASAKKMYGNTAPEVTAAAAAFDQVGIADPGTAPTNNTDLPTSTGAQNVIYYDADANIWRADESGLNPKKIYAAPAYLCSISDDGKVLAFVGGDSIMRKMDLTAATPTATIISKDTIFKSVSVSKDGTKLAAVRFKEDSSIWVTKISDIKWTRIKLYNPTTAKGVVSAGVRYPDVLEWDYTGEKIVYDAYNEIQNSNGSKIDYWDVGIISVWDNTAQAFNAKPNIVKLFPSLPQFISLGNPTFSRTSPNILAFDLHYYDGATEEFDVMGYNMLNDSLATLSTNNNWGYPSFSKADDKVIFYQDVYLKNTPNAGDSTLVPTIKAIGLDASKFNAGANPATTFMSNATVAKYYSAASRQLGTAPVANFQIVKNSLAGVVYRNLLDQSLNKPTSWLWEFTGPLFGGPVFILGTSADPNPTVSFLRDGDYTIKLTVTNQYGSNSMTKTLHVGANGISEETQGSITAYPNPFTDLLRIESAQQFDKQSTVKLFDLSGRLVKEVPSANQNNIEISTSDLSSGVYILEIYTGKTVAKQKFIKQ